MSHSILITGGSGYLGGTLLARLSRDSLPPHKAVYALVRTKDQEEAVRKYGVEPIYIDLEDETAVKGILVEKNINIVFFLIDAFKHERQVTLIKALAEVKKCTGTDVHLLHTTGAKIFSEHAGMPTDRCFADNDEHIHKLQQSARAPIVKPMDIARETNNIIIKTAEEYGVRSYIFIPCIVYGEGEGFGNRISIQTVAVVQAAKVLRRVYDVNSEGAIWPVCHVIDNTTLYLRVLEGILKGYELGHGKHGYYLASSGSVKWRDIYETMARALAKYGVIDDAEVKHADDDAQQKMAEALRCPKEMVPLQLGGHCSLVARHGDEIGWSVQHPADHILENANAEVELILANLKDARV